MSKKKQKKAKKEDDFFKEDELNEADELVEDEIDPEKSLAEDLKAFSDEIKGVKDDIEEELEEEEGEIETEEDKDEEETDNDEKWSLEKPEENDEDDDWLDGDYEEGELAVDVYQDKDNVYIKSTIAGVDPEDIDVSIHNDLLTIRGKREQCDEIRKDDYFLQECYWGSFSRSIILPVEVKAEKIDASLKDGILTVKLPKVKKAKKSQVRIKEK